MTHPRTLQKGALTMSLYGDYHHMVLESQKAPVKYSILAAIFNWLLLAGFVVFPGTFASFNRLGILDESLEGQVIKHAVHNIPLLALAITSCLLGVSGILWLWWIWRYNYIWLVSHIFLYVVQRDYKSLS